MKRHRWCDVARGVQHNSETRRRYTYAQWGHVSNKWKRRNIRISCNVTLWRHPFNYVLQYCWKMYVRLPPSNSPLFFLCHMFMFRYRDFSSFYSFWTSACGSFVQRINDFFVFLYGARWAVRWSVYLVSTILWYEISWHWSPMNGTVGCNVCRC